MKIKISFVMALVNIFLAAIDLGAQETPLTLFANPFIETNSNPITKAGIVFETG